MRKYYAEVFIVSLAVVFSILLVWMYSSRIQQDKLCSMIPMSDEASPGIQYLYGLPADSYKIGGGIIRNNQMLAGLLYELGVSSIVINQVIEKTDSVFDVRKFKAGNKYVTFSTLDSNSELAFLIYVRDAVNYLVFRFGDSIDVQNGARKIDTVQNTFAGSIKTSLWNTFSDMGSNPMLANELSDIYAWTIDFFGLQQGDSLRLIYDEYYVDSASIGIGKISGAWFRHMGNDFWAIPFLQDGTEAFFDDSGQSLRKAFLKAPLRFTRISSRYSNSRLHPILKIRRPHQGIDYAAPVGTPVYSIGDGVIVQTGYEGGAGNMVKIKHNSVYSTAYLHLRNYTKGIKKGVPIKQGDVIGYVGNTGLSTGPHLDFRFYRNGSPVDPLKVEAPSVEPVKKENEEQFTRKKLAVMEEISRF